MADYKLIEGSKGIEKWAVELTSGKYKGVVVEYNSVRFSEYAADCVCHFGYDVVQNNGHSAIHLETSADLHNELGDTLMVLINDGIIHQAAKRQLKEVD